MKLFETHCHLNDKALYQNIDQVIERALKVGVDKMIVVGWDKKSSIKALEIAKKYPFIYAMVGVHPGNIEDGDDETLLQIMELSKDHKVVAIGEIGLDYHYVQDQDIHNKQKEVFIKQIEYANRLGLPISIHSRDAFFDTLQILKQHKPQHGGVMHCFSGDSEQMDEIINLGLHIGLGGPVTFRNAVKPKDVAMDVPLNRLLLETDCPYLSPQQVRGTINEPANIIYVADEIAYLRNMSKKHLLDVVYDNACKLFKI